MEEPHIAIQDSVLPAAPVVRSGTLDVHGASGYIPISTLTIINGHEASSSVYAGHLQTKDRRIKVEVQALRTSVGRTNQSKRILEQELNRLSKAVHVNILPYLGFCEFGLYDYALVRPWVDGVTLKTFLQTHPPKWKIPSLMVDLTNGLEYLHFVAEIVHGDINTETAMVLSSGTACLADLGLFISAEGSADFLADVRTIGSPETDAPEDVCDFDKYGRLDTTHGSCSRTASMRTIRFVAPELLNCPNSRQSGRTKESDIYALGMLLVTVATGHGPWPETSDYSVIYKVVRGETPPRPADGMLLSELWEICLRCWDTDPVRRPTAQDLKQHLSDILQEREQKRYSLVGQRGSGDSTPELMEEISRAPNDPSGVTKRPSAENAVELRRASDIATFCSTSSITWREILNSLRAAPGHLLQTFLTPSLEQAASSASTCQDGSLWMPGAPLEGWSSAALYPVADVQYDSPEGSSGSCTSACRRGHGRPTHKNHFECNVNVNGGRVLPAIYPAGEHLGGRGGEIGADHPTGDSSEGSGGPQ